MKRSPLRRKTPLVRKPFATTPRAVPKPRTEPIPVEAGFPPDKPNPRRETPAKRGSPRDHRRALEPGEAEWKQVRWGRCKACNTYGRVVLHHCVDEQTLRKATSAEQQATGIIWDMRNAIRLGAPLAFGGQCHCHASHHNWGIRDTRLEYSLVHPVAREFALEVLGASGAIDYFQSKYRGVS